MSETADILRKAKALIDTPEKWRQGLNHGDDSKLCAGDAMMSASRELRPIDPAFAYAAARSKVLEGIGRLDGLVLWNDDPTTRHADVMQAFDAAIALAEKP
jgi:hypothetical protein